MEVPPLVTGRPSRRKRTRKTCFGSSLRKPFKFMTKSQKTILEILKENGGRMMLFTGKNGIHIGTLKGTGEKVILTNSQIVGTMFAKGIITKEPDSYYVSIPA